jgi:hypothetical protein
VDQPHHTSAGQQQHGIDVRRADPRAEVQMGLGDVRMAVSGGPDDGSRRDRIADADRYG